MRDLETLFSATVMALVLSALPAAAQVGRIGGTVKDQSGQPIKGATVMAENPDSAPSSLTATTDDRGRYSMIGLKAGTWKVTASAPGFEPSAGNVPLKTIGAPMPPVDFTLAPGASGPSGALAGVNTKELQGELDKAEAMVNAKDYAGAIAVYEGMLAKVPGLTALHMQIGHLYRQQKQYDQAIESYKKVPAGDANSDKARIEIGMTLLEKNDLAGAEAALMEVANSTSADKEVFYNLGEVKFAKGETDEAVKYYQRASDIDPNWGKPLFKLGLARLQKADTAGTLEIMNKLIQVDPNSPEAAQAKGLIEQLKKQ
ncbi:MAG TPA: carboxypeptidase regulatory-like domain-containing protein [Vicinamibacterales bacterium]|nr:carboxypeptidase regulatory-like domain-containing protein [Vicinamibacterales bacterium]